MKEIHIMRKSKNIIGLLIKAKAYLAMTILLSGCHETIHIHPWEEQDINERAVLTLKIENDAPQLGAIIDYTVSPAVIIYSDQIPEKARSAANGPGMTLPDAQSGQEYARIASRAEALSDAFEQIAPYNLDGDKWDLHLKYEVYAATADEVRSGAAAPIHTHDVVYAANADHPEHDVETDLPFGHVTVVAVAHIVPKGYTGDYFFTTSTLHTIISDMDRRQGEHDNVYRDCFVAGQEFFIEPTGIDGNVQHLTACLTRPQGRYVVLADDYEEYLQIANSSVEEAVSHINYPGYMNIAYSLLAKLPVASGSNFGYDFSPSLAEAGGQPYVKLGDDWSFVNGERSNFNVDISVREKADDTPISNNEGIMVPIFQGKVTLVVGHWMLETLEGGGGVAVDPNFTDEIVLHF